MKRDIGCAFVFILCIVTLVGCVKAPGNKGTAFLLQDNHLLKAWVGEWTEDKRMNAISEYRQHYKSVIMNGANGAHTTFETDFDATTAQVVCVAKVKDQDKDFELHEYTDMYIKTECSDNKVTVHTEWWYLGGDGVTRYPTWSYLVRVEDSEGTEHYYYFRVDYSK